MTGGRYFETLRRGAVWLVLLAATGAAVGYGLSTTATPRYRATAQLFVAVAEPIEQLPTRADRFAADEVQSLTGTVRSPAVLRRAIRQRALAVSASGLAAEVSADAPAGKALIDISVTNAEAPRAARLANAVSKAFIALADSPSTGHKVVLVSPAAAPAHAVGTEAVVFTAVGALLGLLIGLVAVPALAVRRGRSP